MARSFLVCFALLSLSTLFGQTLTTAAGGGPDGIPATSASLNSPTAVVADSSGNVFVLNGVYGNRVYKVDTSGQITAIGGSGDSGFAGDGGAALNALLSAPSAIAVDSSGNLYIADTENHRIRKISGTSISTIAGSGTSGFSGDGAAATASQLSFPAGVTVDSSGNVYIADTANHRIRKIAAATGFISTIAGTGAAGFNTDSIPATSAQLWSPSGIALDAAGNLYIADTLNHRIRRVAGTGTITTVAGNGTAGFSGDAAGATAAQLNGPRAIAADSSGNLYIADSDNHRIRKVSSGTISTIAGTGTAGYNGDSIAGSAAQLNFPSGVAVDSGGNLYIADQVNMRVRKIASGTITTFAGNGTDFFAGDSSGALKAVLNNPTFTVLDSGGNLYIADTYNHRIRKLDTSTGVITTIAGNGTAGNTGDAGPATAAKLNGPTGMALDNFGNLYFADTNNHRIRRINGGTIFAVAGTGVAGFGGDNGPVGAIQFNSPHGICVDGPGYIYIADTNNHRIRKLGAGTIVTIIGAGTAGFSGDGGNPTAAQLNGPTGLALDPNNGNLYIGDTLNHRVRKATATTITSLAGTGTSGYNGDGIAATAAKLSYPSGVALDGSGNVYIADTSNHRVRKISGGQISTVAGTGAPGFNGDNFAGTAGQLSFPSAVTVTTSNNLYISDSSNQRVRYLSTAAGTPVTVTITANLAGARVIVDGVTYAPPQVLTWTSGTAHTLDAASPTGLPAGVRYPFSDWSDSGAQSHTVIAPSSPTTYIANFIAQFQLNTAVSPPGGGSISVTPTSSDGYYNGGTVIRLTATPNAGSTFTNFSGLFSSTLNPDQFFLNNTGTVTANFSSGVPITVTANLAAAGIMVDGVTYSPPHTFQFLAGSTHTINAISPSSPPAGTRYPFSSWSDSGAQSHTITIPSSATTYTANFVAQFLLNTSVTPGGTGSIAVSPTSSDGYYDGGTVIQVTGAPNSGFAFSSFSGVFASTLNPDRFFLNGPGTETANFTSGTQVTVTANLAGGQLIVDGITYSPPQTFNWIAGSTHTLNCASPPSPPAGTRYPWNNWSDGGAQSHTITVGTTPITYTANYIAQFLLNAAVFPAGSGSIAVSPSSPDGYYNGGTTIQVTGTPNSGFSFSNFSGTFTSTLNPDRFFLNTTGTVTANFH